MVSLLAFNSDDLSSNLVFSRDLLPAGRRDDNGQEVAVVDRLDRGRDDLHLARVEARRPTKRRGH